ncbi:M3 family oligoendopeptidase [Tepidamorphus sp. 3E244]|uniref:M3 family oligoendopeptidase n=1 Tax=Tepidamorphus sp. 3E244 TaxID=3385498 RepID=UPI0038FD3F4A
MTFQARAGESFAGFVRTPQGAKAAAAKDLGTMPEWDLSDLYDSPESPKVAEDLKRADDWAKDFEQRFKGKLYAILKQDGSKGLFDIIAEYEQLDELFGKLWSYAGLLHATDVSDTKISKFYGDVSEKLTAAGVHLLFFTLELNRLPDGALDEAMASAPLDHYKPWLEDVRIEKPYQLDDELERLFHEKSVTGRGAWNRLFDQTISSLTFDVDGEELSIEPTLNKLQDSDGDVRKAAAMALGETFSKHTRTFALITNTLAKDKEISDRWRGFEDIADSRHLANRVEREVVDALVKSVEDAYPRLSHRYYAIKAKWFGGDQLDYWDRNAPLPHVPQRQFNWKDAESTVLDAYGSFSPKMADVARDFFDKGWIDAPTRSGKSPGAFAHPTVPSVHPYVLMNFQGKARDVMTLAHELGHGVHQVLAGRQGALMAPTPLTLAETASVFGEMLTFKSLLSQSDDPVERKAMLAGKIEDMLNTVVRQIAFYQFERKVHAERKNGELTADQLGELWMSVQHSSLGPAIRLGDGYETFWSYIPHFIHSPFYVYAYAFGDCLVNSLYAIYEKASDGFVEKYFDMLKAGGTKHHSELLAPFGLDARDPSFWTMGLKVIEGLIDDLDALEKSA